MRRPSKPLGGWRPSSIQSSASRTGGRHTCRRARPAMSAPSCRNCVRPLNVLAPHAEKAELPPDDQVHRRLGKDVLLHSVAERGKVDAFEQGLALAEQDRRDGEVYLVE